MLVVALFYLILAAAYLSLYHWNFSAFVKFAPGSIASAFRSDNLYLHSDWGYDGQLYYLIARNPFDLSRLENATGAPVWQYQRLIYPFVVYLLSGFGQPALVPFFLVAVNFLALLTATYFLGKIFEHFNCPAYLSLIYMLSLGFISVFIFDLSEAVAYLAVILAVYFYLDKRHNLAVLFLGLGVLAKEVTLIVPIGFMFYFLARREVSNALRFGAPIGVYFVWFVFLHLLFSKSGYLMISAFDLGTPFVGWLVRLKLFFLQQPSLSTGLDGLAFLLLALLGALLMIDFFKKINPFNIIGLLYLIFIFCFQPTLILYPKEYGRNFLGFMLFALLSYLYNRNRWLLFVLAAYLVLSVMFVVQIFTLAVG